MSRNPFTPSFGTSPPILVGREALIQEFVDSLYDGPGSPGRMTLYTGARGTGKTVMLNEVQDAAEQLGWIVIAETATAGLVQRLVREHLPGVLAQLDGNGPQKKLSGVSLAAVGGVTWETQDDSTVVLGLRALLSEVCDRLAVQGTGLLLTVDEIHHGQLVELRELATVLQHLVREDREIAFVGAGLPSAVQEVLNDDVLTFFRRADQHTLGKVSITEVEEAIGRPIRDNDREISPELVEIAASATAGYPFLIQLIGFHIWRRQPKEQQISSQDVSDGIDAARRRLGALVLAPELAELTEVERTFLLSMASDTGPSKMKDIATRMGVDGNYASQYRLRLITRGIIEPVKHGVVGFTMPYFRDYLRDSVAFDAHNDGQDN